MVAQRNYGDPRKAKDSLEKILDPRKCFSKYFKEIVFERGGGGWFNLKPVEKIIVEYWDCSNSE